jgi:hypothetical protein
VTLTDLGLADGLKALAAARSQAESRLRQAELREIEAAQDAAALRTMLAGLAAVIEAFEAERAARAAQAEGCC